MIYLCTPVGFAGFGGIFKVIFRPLSGGTSVRVRRYARPCSAARLSVGVKVLLATC